jgi:hypothetical protein
MRGGLALEKSDLETLKILEDLIRRVVREELERARPLSPLFDGRQWGLDVPSAPEPHTLVYTARHD